MKRVVSKKGKNQLIPVVFVLAVVATAMINPAVNQILVVKLKMGKLFV